MLIMCCKPLLGRKITHAMRKKDAFSSPLSQKKKLLASMRVIIFLGHMSTESFSNLVKTHLNADSRVVLHTSNLGSMEIGHLPYFLIFSSQNA